MLLCFLPIPFYHEILYTPGRFPTKAISRTRNPDRRNHRTTNRGFPVSTHRFRIRVIDWSRCPLSNFNLLLASSRFSFDLRISFALDFLCIRFSQCASTLSRRFLSLRIFFNIFCFLLFFFDHSGNDEIRTRDLLHATQMRYQLRHIPISLTLTLLSFLSIRFSLLLAFLASFFLTCYSMPSTPPPDFSLLPPIALLSIRFFSPLSLSPPYTFL
jgi:hypothetical protein